MLKNFILAIVTILLWGCGDNVDKANQLIETGAYDQAISLLDKEIQSNPNKKEAHLAMGNCLATKYCNSIIEGVKEESKLIELSQKAIKYYKSSLQIEQDYNGALFNLSDFNYFIRREQEAKAGFKKLFDMDRNNASTYMFLDWNDTTMSYLRKYLESIYINQTFEIVPQENRGTIIIICSNCETFLTGDSENDLKVKLRKYNVYAGAKIKNDKVEFIYDTIEKLGEEEFFYRVKILKRVRYSSGWQEVEYGSKDYGYHSKLYRKILTNREKRILSEAPGQIPSENLDYLFTGKFLNASTPIQYPNYSVRDTFKYVYEKDYREIEKFGKPEIFKINKLGFYSKPGKIIFQKVKAKKYIKNVDRYGTVATDEVVFGIGNLYADKGSAHDIEDAGIFNENQKLLLLRGKANKGTPKKIIEFISHRKLKLIKKYYVDEICYEHLKNNITKNIIVFRNNLLEDVF